MNNHDNHHQFAYTIIGAGPAGICAVAKLMMLGVSGEEICWIDPHFACGDFGTIFSVGSGVPGNTRVAEYKRVNQAIYKALPDTAPTADELAVCDLLRLPDDETCSLKEAALPMQHLSYKLRRRVQSYQGLVTDITAKGGGWLVAWQDAAGVNSIISQRVILATGALPRQLDIPLTTIERIDPCSVFIWTELQAYLAASTKVKKVAVVGSSHSAALAVMHLLRAGIPVIQFVNKPYRFARRSVSADGQAFTMYDNTGLKGEVAKFTSDLLNGQVGFAFDWQQVASSEMHRYLNQCSHLVEAIGYTANSTLTINGRALGEYSYDCHTSEIQGLKNVFGMGIAFPLEVVAPSGEVELSVGYGKFWAAVNDEHVLSCWGVPLCC